MNNPSEAIQRLTGDATLLEAESGESRFTPKTVSIVDRAGLAADLRAVLAWCKHLEMTLETERELVISGENNLRNLVAIVRGADPLLPVSGLAIEIRDRFQAALRESLKFYNADGSFVLMESPEAVIESRKIAAAEHAQLIERIKVWHDELTDHHEGDAVDAVRAVQAKMREAVCPSSPITPEDLEWAKHALPASPSEPTP